MQISGTSYSMPLPRFGAIKATPFQHIVNMTDFNNAFSDGEIALHQSDVRDYLTHHHPKFPWLRMANWHNRGFRLSKETPEVLRLSTAPAGNVDLQSLFVLGVAGRHRQGKNQDIVVSVVDPGVGQRLNDNGEQIHDRSILITYDHKGNLSTPVIISPNNGSLALMTKSFQQQNIPYDVFPIDINKVEKLEADRKGVGMAHIFHGRDLFGVLAAYIAAGVDPRSFRDTSRPPMTPEPSAFLQHLGSLPTQPGDEAQPVYAVYDPTFDGNLKTSIVLSNRERQTYQNQLFEITGPNGTTMTVPFKQAFNEVPKGEPLLYLGSSYAPYLDAEKSKDAHFVELAVNYGSAAKLLGISPHQAGRLTIRLKPEVQNEHSPGLASPETGL